MIDTFPTATAVVAMSRTKGSPFEGAANEIGFVPREAYINKNNKINYLVFLMF